MVPLIIRFDGAANVNGAAIVRFPKLNQGAPYEFGLKVRYEDLSYRQWNAEGIRWRIKLRPTDKHDLMILTLANNNFVVDEDTLNFIVKASDWDEVVIPVSSNHLEMDVPFSHIVEFLDNNGVVTERFASGSGLITTNLDL